VKTAKLARDVAAQSTVLLDTNVLIAYLDGGQTITEAASLIIDRWIRHGRNRAIVSAVSAMELLAGPIRAQRGLDDAMDFLTRFPNLRTTPVDLAAARHGAEIRARHRLKPPDSLIIGTAIAARADAIVTNDGKWSSTCPVRVITLGEYVE